MHMLQLISGRFKDKDLRRGFGFPEPRLFTNGGVSKLSVEVGQRYPLTCSLYLIIPIFQGMHKIAFN